MTTEPTHDRASQAGEGGCTSTSDESVPSGTPPLDEDAFAEGNVRAVHAVLRQCLCEDLDATWEDVLAGWSDATRADRKAVRAYVGGVRTRILQGLLDIDDFDELQYSVAIQYVELRCHWTMLNTRIQHQTAEGKPDDRLLYRATCISHIVDALEAVLPPATVDRLAQFVAEPLRGTSDGTDAI